MGLGLFVCKSIIEAHGGRIWAENNADDKGSTFTFSLPLLSTK
jgi:signal transduction histidine kinase